MKTVNCAFGLAALVLAVNAWPQSAWPSYPNNSSIAVSSNGSVGIGTSNPSSSYGGIPAGTTPSLDIVSTASANATQLRLISAPTVAGQYSSGIVFGASDNTTNGWSYNVARIYSLFDAPLWTAGRLTFATPTGSGTWVDTMSIKNGSVGIGTNNPQYTLAVNGSVGAKDIIVTTTGWSDYVFRPDYRLLPLREVRAYISDHGHLPEIPSESEVKEKGVSMAEMQVKLLAKVEELTLHMIHADERNNRLEHQNQELRERLERLEKTAAGDSALAVAK